ncbi:hypothetical protein GYMLUDRAFT_182511, partial [Collybiopsis luxurians FD-317 M1]
VIVRFKAIGNAPIMKQNFFKITSSNRFQAVIQILRKELGYKGLEPLMTHFFQHTFINLAFLPAPNGSVPIYSRSVELSGDPECYLLSLPFQF